MNLSLSTPGLLFPAISLLFLSYTNRFLSYAALVRGLHERWGEQPDPAVQMQIGNLRRRLLLIRHMQTAGGTREYDLLVIGITGIAGRAGAH